MSYEELILKKAANDNHMPLKLVIKRLLMILLVIATITAYLS